MQDPIIQLSSHFELERAERIVNMLKAVANAVGEVIDRVDFILVACARVLCVFYSVDDWVS